jgi:glutamate racemase
VFDSGVGGAGVAQAIQEALPELEVYYADDHEHIPYGNRDPEEIKGFVVPILQALVDEGCEAIVIACNTVTTTLITDLRDIVSVPLIGTEPMVKPAAETTKTGVIAICATPTTLASQRYAWLKQEYAKGLQVIEPDCSNWTRMIESNNLDHDHIEHTIRGVCEQGADVIVLGCTHYHWIEEEIQAIAKEFKATVIQPEPALIRQLKRVLALQP